MTLQATQSGNVCSVMLKSAQVSRNPTELTLSAFYSVANPRKIFVFVATFTFHNMSSQLSHFSIS